MEIQKLDENLPSLNLCSDYILYLRQHTSNPQWKAHMDSEKGPPSTSSSQLQQQQQTPFRYLPYLQNPIPYSSSLSTPSSSTLPPSTSFLSPNLQQQPTPFLYSNLTSDVDTRLPLSSSIPTPSELQQQQNSSRYSPLLSFLQRPASNHSASPSIPSRFRSPLSPSSDLPLSFQLPTTQYAQGNSPIDVFAQPPPLMNVPPTEPVGFARPPSTELPNSMPSADSILPISNDTALLLMQGMGSGPGVMNMNVGTLAPPAGTFTESATSNLFAELEQPEVNFPEPVQPPQSLGFPRPSPPVRKRGRPEKPPVVCIKCGKVRKHKAKGMCFSCFQNQPKYSYRKEKYKRKKQMEISTQHRETPNNSNLPTNHEPERRVTRSHSGGSQPTPTTAPQSAELPGPPPQTTESIVVGITPQNNQPSMKTEKTDEMKADVGDKPPPANGESIHLNTESVVQ